MNLGKAFAAALHPTNWRVLAHGVVPSIEHARPLAAIAPGTVIDVGANKGQFASFAAARWPGARIIAFEPLDEPAARFRRVVGSRATLLRCALGAVAERREIHIASRADSSSLLPLADLQKTVFAMDEVGVRTIDVRRLEDAIPADVPTPILLKIDVQGFEYEVLEGLGTLADRIAWIYVESSFRELYTGQKLYPAIAALLDRLGFVETGRFNAHSENGTVLQADVLFTRRDDREHAR